MKPMNSSYVCSQEFCKCTNNLFGGYYYNDNDERIGTIDLSDIKDQCYCWVYDIIDGKKITNNSLTKTNCTMCSAVVERPHNENDFFLELERMKLEFDKKEKAYNEEIKSLKKQLRSSGEDRYCQIVADELRLIEEASNRFRQRNANDECLQTRKDDIAIRAWEESGGGYSDK